MGKELVKLHKLLLVYVKIREFTITSIRYVSNAAGKAHIIDAVLKGDQLLSIDPGPVVVLPSHGPQNLVCKEIYKNVVTLFYI